MTPIKITFPQFGTDRVVACGLVIMGIISVTGNIIYTIQTGTSGGSEIPMAIVSGLTGFLGRGVLDNATSTTQQSPKKDSLVSKEDITTAAVNILKGEDKAEAVKKEVTNIVTNRAKEEISKEATNQLSKLFSRN